MSTNGLLVNMYEGKSPICVVHYKPLLSPLLLLLFGVACLFMKVIIGKLIGIALIVITVSFYFQVKDYIVLELYENGVMIHNQDDGNDVKFVKYNEIKEWSVRKNNKGMTIVEFLLKDNTYICKTVYRHSNITKYLKKYVNTR